MQQQQKVPGEEELAAERAGGRRARARGKGIECVVLFVVARRARRMEGRKEGRKATHTALEPKLG